MAIAPDLARRITLVSVSGLPDARGAALALAFSQRHMPGCRALLCSPVRPEPLPPGVEHQPIAPLNYHEYSWFMLFALWRVVSTEFALVVQEDGWVLDGNNWRDEYLHYDYIGAPIHLARIDPPPGAAEGAPARWSRGFAWSTPEHPWGQGAVPVQNGGFSLRSQRLMRALTDHPHIRVQVPPPDIVGGEPLRMHWHNDALLEDVQLTGLLRPALEAVGLRFAPVELARGFAIEHAGLFHHGFNAMQIFGHHSRLRRLVALDPPTVRFTVPRQAIQEFYGEPDLVRMLEHRGYRVEFAPDAAAVPDSSTPPTPTTPVARRVFDCFTYNGEVDVLAIRLHELAPVVDCFVVVEATRTFNGEAKPLRFDPAHPLIAPFAARIRYVVVDDMPDDPPDAPTGPVDGDWLTESPRTGFWLREKFQRNQIMRGLHDVAPDDWVIISDADEIPRAEVVRQMREQPADRVFVLQQRLYYFYANFRNVAGPEAATVWSVAAARRWFDTGTPDRLRIQGRSGSLPGTVLLPDAGWHFSYLGMGEDAVRAKIAQFAHQEHNDPAFLRSIDLQALVRSGRDLYGRPGYVWALEEGGGPAWLRATPALHRLFFGGAPV